MCAMAATQHRGQITNAQYTCWRGRLTERRNYMLDAYWVATTALAYCRVRVYLPPYWLKEAPHSVASPPPSVFLAPATLDPPVVEERDRGPTLCRRDARHLGLCHSPFRRAVVFYCAHAHPFTSRAAQISIGCVQCPCKTRGYSGGSRALYSMQLQRS